MKRQDQLSTDTLTAVVAHLQDRYRRHYGRYTKIAAIGQVPMSMVNQLLHHPPEAVNWQFRTLQNLERGLDVYEQHLIEEITGGTHTHNQA